MTTLVASPSPSLVEADTQNWCVALGGDLDVSCDSVLGDSMRLWVPSLGQTKIPHSDLWCKGKERAFDYVLSVIWIGWCVITSSTK